MELNGTIFLQVIIFLAALLWLSPALFKPIIRLFDERDHKIRGAKIESEELNALALDKAKTFDVEYNKAKDKARDFLSSIKQSLDHEQAERLQKAKDTASLRLSQAEADISQQSKTARDYLDKQVPNLANEIVNALQGHSIREN